MGTYSEVLRPESFVPHALGQIEGSQLSFAAEVKAIRLKTGTRKAAWMKPLFSGLGVSVDLLEPEWQEDDPENQDYFSPGRKAGLKAVDWVGDNREGISSEQGVVLSIGTDVDLLNSNGKVIGKPNGVMSRAEVENLMVKEMGGSDPLEFICQTSVGLYGREIGQVDDGSGLSAVIEYPFAVLPLSQEEVEFYIYGLSGRSGDYPGYLLEIFERLQGEYQLDVVELKRLSDGFTPEELRMTNGGYRWPHPLLHKHTVQVGGLERISDSYDRQLMRLYLGLLGAPAETRKLLDSYPFASRLSDQSSSIYPELTGSWGHMIELNNGEWVIVQKVTPQDFGPISEMVSDNFRHAPNFSNLSAEAREAYLEANNLSGVGSSCCNPENIACLVAKNLSGKVVGYRLVRRGNHPKTNEEVAEGRRLHVLLEMAGQGLGRKMMQLSEQISKEQGFDILTAQASGSSTGFFEKNGFTPIFPEENDVNGVLADKGIETPIVRMQKEL